MRIFLGVCARGGGLLDSSPLLSCFISQFLLHVFFLKFGGGMGHFFSHLLKLEQPGVCSQQNLNHDRDLCSQ
jgi:hypothetical protein